MELSDKAITEFKQIWKEEHGEDISDEKAHIEAGRLLKLISVIYKPIQKDDHGQNR